MRAVGTLASNVLTQCKVHLLNSRHRRIGGRKFQSRCEPVRVVRFGCRRYKSRGSEIFQMGALTTCSALPTEPTSWRAAGSMDYTSSLARSSWRLHFRRRPHPSVRFCCELDSCDEFQVEVAG